MIMENRTGGARGDNQRLKAKKRGGGLSKRDLVKKNAEENERKKREAKRLYRGNTVVGEHRSLFFGIPGVSPFPLPPVPPLICQISESRNMQL